MDAKDPNSGPHDRTLPTDPSPQPQHIVQYTLLSMIKGKNKLPVHVLTMLELLLLFRMHSC